MGGNMKENSFARFILVLLAVIALWCIAIFHFDTETESNTEKIQGKLERDVYKRQIRRITLTAMTTSSPGKTAASWRA